MKIHWPAILSGAVTAVGILTSPAVFALLTAKQAIAVTVGGAILQGFTKPAVKKS